MVDGHALGVWLIPIVAIVGWVVYAIIESITRGRVRELQVRERIMMVEKGLVPPPEVDPRGFEQRMRELDPSFAYARYRTYRRRQSAYTLIAVGLGLNILLFPNFRVGSFLMVLGLGFLIASLFDPPPPPNLPPPPPPPEPPRPNP